MGSVKSLGLAAICAVEMSACCPSFSSVNKPADESYALICFGEESEREHYFCKARENSRKMRYEDADDNLRRALRSKGARISDAEIYLELGIVNYENAKSIHIFPAQRIYFLEAAAAYLRQSAVSGELKKRKSVYEQAVWSSRVAR